MTTKVRVRVQISMDQFKSEWSDPDEAAQVFCGFLRDAWRNDLKPLVTLGVGVQIEVGTAHQNNPKLPGIDIRIDPYQSDAFDMMTKTREMLSDQDEVWERFLSSPTALALYK